jgi:hypothetical protein
MALTPGVALHNSKAAEMSFLNVYKAMRDVPDPSTTLADVVEELHSVIPLQAQHDKMESELRQVVLLLHLEAHAAHLHGGGNRD